MNINNTIQYLTIAALPLIFAITLHEAAHGLVAKWFGDKTAMMMGRLTLNPIKHIDPIGTIVVPVLMIFLSGFVFGWAKPVPVTSRNLSNPKRDMAFVALAGPMANLLMAFLWAAVAAVALAYIAPDTHRGVAVYFLNAGMFGIQINLVLMILNLLPLPPLDGGHVLMSIVPNKVEAKLMQVEPYGIWILLALLVTGLLGRIIMPIFAWAYLHIALWFGLPII